MKTAVLIVLIACAGSSFGQRVFATEEGAIKGYDPVAYFTENKPVKGLDSYTYDWNGATWYFSSESNMRRFMSDPTMYAPQYGGYCAYGLANGYKVKIEPEAWAIIDNRLFLNYDLDVQKQWDRNREALINKADEYWPRLRDEIVD